MIKVVRGSPNHLELAALTAVFVALVRGSHALRDPLPRSRRAGWDRQPPYLPAHSWRSHAVSPPR
ncbi:acyl-CoA carboxylase subunit epsilon [Streptomyces solicavernae]|uniref:acyl-CoA carboxylase subunit epsilon n=1 Tax=Streptomyces solicavernae TaxID=3043614 RepID=UPI0038D0F1D4